MRILFINSVCGYGSTGRIVTDLYDEFESKGHECVIAYGRGKASENYETYKIGNKMDFIGHAIQSRILDNHGFASKNATVKLISFIEEYKPDVIHLHNLHGYYLNIEILFKYLKKIQPKLVWTFHDCWPFSPHSAYIDYDSKGYLPTSATRSDLKNYPRSFIMNRSKKNYLKKKQLFLGLDNLTIVTPSIWLKKMVDKSFLGIYKKEVINNGINLEKFQPQVYSKNSDIYDLSNYKIILGVASVWEERKGLSYLFELSKTINEDQKIVIVGNIKRIKTPDNVINIKRTDSILELARLYSVARVFVNPTLEDNFPTTNLEALACGTPVLTFKTGGSGEPISNNLVGSVVDKGDELALSNAVTMTYRDKKSMKEIKKCREKALKYSEKNMMDEYVSIFNAEYSQK